MVVEVLSFVIPVTTTLGVVMGAAAQLAGVVAVALGITACARIRDPRGWSRNFDRVVDAVAAAVICAVAWWTLTEGGDRVRGSAWWDLMVAGDPIGASRSASMDGTMGSGIILTLVGLAAVVFLSRMLFGARQSRSHRRAVIY